MEKYDISIIIPVYNAEKTLENCLNSIINQKGVNFEVICINDGSKDNSLSILNDYASKYDNFVIINQENKGVSAARNAGIDASRGEYLTFVDADDGLLEDSLCTIDLSEKFDLYKFGYDYLDKNVSRKVAYQGKTIILNEENFKDTYISIMNNVDENMVWGQLLKKEALANVRFDSKYFYGEDILFNSAVLDNIKSIKYINKVIYHYERQNSSVTNNLSYETVKRKVINLCGIFTEIIENHQEFKSELQIKSLREIIPQIIMMENEKYDFVEENKYLNEVFKNILPSQIPEKRYEIGYKLLVKKQYKIFKLYRKIYINMKKIKNSL